MCPKRLFNHRTQKFEPSPNEFVRSLDPPTSPLERTSADGSTPSPTGTPGEPSPSELRHLRELLTESLGGLGADLVLTGPLTITGAGLKDSAELRLPLRSMRSKKVGEAGFTCTLYLDWETVQSLAKACGVPGSHGTAAVSFGVSIPILEPLTT